MNETAVKGPERDAAEHLLAVLDELVHELHPGRGPLPIFDLDSSLDTDLGLDSLSRVELLSRIERRFEAVLPERLFAEAETPRDLLRALLRAVPSEAGSAIADISKLTLGAAEPTPATATTLIQTLNWHVARHPDRLHIRFYQDDSEGETLSYRQLKAGAMAVAIGLQAQGLQPAQAVAIMLPTGADYFFAFFGALLAGGIPVPIYPPTRLSQLEEHLIRHIAILANCAAPLFITVPEVQALAGMLQDRLVSLQAVTSVADLSASSGELVEPQVNARDTALLQYTSGSTGKPKGVVLSHANLIANIRAMGAAVNSTPDDVFVSWLPLYHDMGLIGAWLGSLYFAFPLVIMPPMSFLSRPQRWLRAIHRYRGTLSSAPNFGYELCRRRLEPRDLEGLDLSSWRCAFNGAETVSPETIDGFIERFRPFGFQAQAMWPVYGLAESSVGLAFPPAGRGPLIDRVRREPFARLGRAIPAGESDPNPLRFVACGAPLPGHQIRVVDDRDRELPDRQQGNIQFLGPSATSGYFRDSEHTRSLFHGGWLDTGDLGYVVDGELYVTGRIKDLIIRAGRNIHPQEIEQAVGGIEGVRQGSAAAVGVRNPEAGTERLVVIAETRLHDPLQREDLRARINTAVSELIGEPADEVVLAPPGAVLKTSSGKVRRAAIRALYENGVIGRPRGRLWTERIRLRLAGLAARGRRLRGRLFELGFAAYGWAIFGLLAPLVWSAVMLLPTLDARWRVMRAAIRLLRALTRTPLRVVGLENLPKPGEAFVLVSNHASYLDAYVLIAAIPRTMGFVAKAELGRDKRLGLALTRIGAEFVERFEAEKGADDARRLAGILRRGRTLAYFAEGTFTRMPGLRPFHLGAFTAAVETGVPVIPVALRGTRAMLRGDTWFPRPGAIAVTLGKPIDTTALCASAGDPWQASLLLRDAARARILRHCGEPDLERARPSSPGIAE
ncbi:AMP-binding protein [Methylococcus sp. EFPC2]|uniref:AMP-binding protein n=1 Tax=Methylococcus sp. EFPC2 TaxID=2812648 RepID=UPI001967E54F|nr:AMP-binding protein [Methylococcus sp. EFPC2]QSA98900.1 AMP-binding protein [Methylococcus sp. EFPC2]